jgi:hypothetical protein
LKSLSAFVAILACAIGSGFSILAAKDERPAAQSPSEESPSKSGEKPNVTPNAEGFYGVAMIRVYDDAGNVIETHEHKGEFKEW